MTGIPWGNGQGSQRRFHPPNQKGRTRALWAKGRKTKGHRLTFPSRLHHANTRMYNLNIAHENVFGAFALYHLFVRVY